MASGCWFTGSSLVGTGNGREGQSACGGGRESGPLEWEQESEEVRSLKAKKRDMDRDRVWRTSGLGWASKMFLRVIGCQHRSLNWAVARSVVCFSELLAVGHRAAISWVLSPEATWLHLNFIFPPFGF